MMNRPRSLRFVGIVLVVLISCKAVPKETGTACISVDPSFVSGERAKALVSATYLLSFSGPVFMQDVAMSGTMAWVTLPAGKWTVKARAIDRSKRDIAAGTVSMIEVARGKTSPVSIALN